MDDFLASSRSNEPTGQEDKLVKVVHHANAFLFTILCDSASFLKEYDQYQGTADLGRFLPKMSNHFHLALSVFTAAREKVSKKSERKAIRYAKAAQPHLCTE